MDPSTLHAALAQRRERAVVDVQRLLEQLSRIDRWVGGPLPDDLAAHLRSDRRRLADELADLLVDWYGAGGGIDLLEIDTAGYPPDGGVGDVAPEGTDMVVELDGPQLGAEPDGAQVFDELDGSTGFDEPDGPKLAAELGAAAEAVEAPSEEPPPPPPVPPASGEALAALANHFGAGGYLARPSATPPGRAPLGPLLQTVREARVSGGSGAAARRAVQLLPGWLGLLSDDQVLLGEWLAAELRALQEAGGEEDAAPLRRALTEHQRTHQAGFVHGLALHHSPRRGSWAEDARWAWTTLERRAADEEDTDELAIPGRTPRPPTTRLRPAAPEEDEAERDTPVPVDWPCFSCTRGKRAVLVGGDPREPNRLRLEAAFEFAELRWEKTEFTRNGLQKVRDRVRAGGVDLVIVLSRFVGHDTDQVIQPACREHGVPFVPVPKGYGVVGVRLAIERHLGGRGSGGA